MLFFAIFQLITAGKENVIKAVNVGTEHFILRSHLQVGKDIIKHRATKKAPEVAIPRLSFWAVLCLCIIPVQPLADIVGNYARQYGD